MALQLQLKAIKYSGWASQETACYEAKLYVDGKSFASTMTLSSRAIGARFMTRLLRSLMIENCILGTSRASIFRTGLPRLWRHGAANVWTSTLLGRT